MYVEELLAEIERINNELMALALSTQDPLHMQRAAMAERCEQLAFLYEELALEQRASARRDKE